MGDPGTGSGLPLLSLSVLLPALGGVLLWLGVGARAARMLAIGFALALMVVVLAAVARFDADLTSLQLVERWGPLQLGIDGISVLFLPLTALLTLLCFLGATRWDWAPTAQAHLPPERLQARYYGALLLLAASLTGAFTAATVWQFWLFITLEALPAWYLAGRFGRDARSRGVARDFLLVMLLSSAVMFIGFELLSSRAGGVDYTTLREADIPAEAQYAVFVFLAAAFAIKAPVFPLHGWLPKVLENGPVVGLGVFLVGIKVGTYGYLRFVIEPLPTASVEWGPVLAILGAVGAVYGAVVALIQTDLRRLLAYASLSHMGVILIGLFSLNHYGLKGGLLQMLSIGMAVAALYILAGFIAQRVERPDISRLGDLARRAPLLSAAFLIAALAAVGMPGTSGFNGEHLVVIGAYKAHWMLALAVGLSTVLTAAYLLRFFQLAFMEPVAAERRERSFEDLRGSERAVAGAIIAAVLTVGLYTGPFIALVRGSVEAVSSSRYPSMAAAQGGGVPGMRAAETTVGGAP